LLATWLEIASFSPLESDAVPVATHELSAAKETYKLLQNKEKKTTHPNTITLVLYHTGNCMYKTTLHAWTVCPTTQPSTKKRLVQDACVVCFFESTKRNNVRHVDQVDKPREGEETERTRPQDTERQRRGADLTEQRSGLLAPASAG
jgi:hypothetical protein